MKKLLTITVIVFLSLLLNDATWAEGSNYIQVDGAGRQRVPKSLLTRVSVELEDVTFENALAVISKKGNFQLSYNRARIPVSKKITMEMKNVFALEALLEVLERTNTKLLVTNEGHIAIVSASSDNVNKGVIKGKVLDAQTGQPLWGTNISIPELRIGASSGEDGGFRIERVPDGNHAVQFSYIGYEVQKINVLELDGQNLSDLEVQLQPEAVSLSQVIVTPGQFSIMGKGPGVKQTLTREDLEIQPLGEDVYRATTRLPGVAAGDFSAKFNIRGGENDEVLVMIDGMELYDPFHVKDVDGGVMSIIDVAAIEGIELLTGGFSAEYGNRKSGVLKMQSRKPEAGSQRTSLGLSFMNARMMTEGTFAGNKGSWFFSARRGYLDLVLDLMGEKDPPKPVYYDFLNRVEYRLNDQYTLSANFLHASDNMDFTEDDDDVSDTGYKNYYVWSGLKGFHSKKIASETILSYARLSHDRRGIGFEGNSELENYNVRDEKAVDIFGLKQDWQIDISDRWFLKTGGELKHLSSSYDYRSFLTSHNYVNDVPVAAQADTVLANLNPSGDRYSVYLSNRFRVISPLTVELGLRYDNVSYTDDALWSPRVNMVYKLGQQTFLRGGWGYFYQSQDIHNLNAPDNDTRFHKAELAKHWVAGLEHTLRNGLNFRVEGYYKELTDLRAQYRNLSNTIEVFQEVQFDRYKLNFDSRIAKGLEAYIKYDRGGKVTWWASYALARVDDDIHSLVFQGNEFFSDGRDFSGRYDQRHSIHLDLNYRPNKRWHLNLAWQFHSGWPYTPQSIESNDSGYFQSYGDFNSTNYSAYQRMDFTVNRHFYTSRGRVSLFMTLINLYNHENERNIEYAWRWDNTNQRPFLLEEPEFWFKLLPSIGLNWTWGK